MWMINNKITLNMENPYYSNYINSINNGMINSKYFSKNIELNGDAFFKDINNIMNELRESKSRIFFFGNGASAAFANHMALDFSKNGKILSRSLSDSALLTALSNDYTFEGAMVEYLKIEGVSKNDFIISISSSGNSPNIVNVLNYCNENGIKTLALSGLKENNKSVQLANYSIYVPMKTYGMVECIHQVFLHSILDESMDIFEWDREEFQNMNADNFKL
jgi:D-sedoheptulose 7-phosphate isomerase